MNQCVPSWDLPNHPNSPKDVPSLAELTWENGQLAMHGLGAPRPASSGPPTWDKPRAGGTLESIVNQATKPDEAKDLVPWFEHHRARGSASIMDALVPCTNDPRQQQPPHVRDSFQAMGAGCSTRVGSCSGAAGQRVTNGSVSESATCGGSREMTLDTWEREFPVTGLTSPEYTVSGQDHTKTSAADDRDSISHRSRSHASDRKAEAEEGKRRDKGKSSVSRAAAIHNQSERKRRDKINQRMKTLQKLVPNSSKSDKASMLDEVIEYLKQLQAQVHMMSRLNLPTMMLPLAMQQQQLQMSMMGMGMGMAGMGMGIMDINTISRPPVAAFMPVPPASWDNPGDSFPTPPPAASVIPDPLAALLASCQSQPITMDAYSRLAAMYQQLQQQQQPGSKT